MLPEHQSDILENGLQIVCPGGYIEYDSSSQKYSLPIEHALALVNENSPAYVAGGFQVLMSLYKDAPKILEVFKTGNGIAWGDHDRCCYNSIY